MTCVLLVGHGSRDDNANAEVHALADAYRAARPELRVEVAFIELARPLLSDAIAVICAGDDVPDRLVLAPLFLFAAGHVKNDLPLALDQARSAFPGVAFASAPALGVHSTLVSLAVERAAAVLPADAAARAKTVLVVVGRGASDPDANGDFCKVARLIGEGRGLMHVEPTFLGITRPKVEETLDLASRLRPDRIVVLPYLLFAGRLVERLRGQIQAFRAQHTWIDVQLADHLGVEARVFELLDARVSGAFTGTSSLACDTCQYRAALPGLADRVGGLRALLYSVRHTLTHAQAAMPIHLHRPLKKHVLVCGNADCVDRGSIAVLEALRREVKASGSARETKVTRTSCMGRCGEGPTVAVYPDGVWYRGVAAEDAREIVTEHLVADRLVGRLVDDILQ
jgi:sirohydrochlorin cobaltochelatase